MRHGVPRLKLSADRGHGSISVLRSGAWLNLRPNRVRPLYMTPSSTDFFVVGFARLTFRNHCESRLSGAVVTIIAESNFLVHRLRIEPGAAGSAACPWASRAHARSKYAAPACNHPPGSVMREVRSLWRSEATPEPTQKHTSNRLMREADTAVGPGGSASRATDEAWPFRLRSGEDE
jgi:hypothetical protein